ncbi:MAG: DUF309 domain-containing protein [Oligoflexia bacterium]|nr:DUF309 domain-containing protein [Oligoflexia bacterium]
MTLKKRYAPHIDFPPYLFIPGKAPHPEKEGYLKGQHIEFSGTWEESNSDAWINGWLYAIDLFNHQYFWDAHVYLEALWNMLGRKGDQPDFLKALIKISAGGVKLQMGQDELVQAHFERAKELLLAIDLSYFDQFLETHKLIDFLARDSFQLNDFLVIELN